MKHLVMYKESEKGWGGEVWYIGYDTLQEAQNEILKVNSKNTSVTAPNIYTIASYQGLKEKIPESYSF